MLKPIKIYNVKTMKAKAHEKRTSAHERITEVAAPQNKI
jgi:hypothetical protein